MKERRLINLPGEFDSDEEERRFREEELEEEEIEEESEEENDDNDENNDLIDKVWKEEKRGRGREGNGRRKKRGEGGNRERKGRMKLNARLNERMMKAEATLDEFKEKISLDQRIKYYIPFLSWINQYNFSFFKNDLIAGMTVSIMLLPQCLAFANLLEVRTSLGLQTGFFPLLIYLFFGTSKQLAMGPETVVSILTASLLDNIVGVPDGAIPSERDHIIDKRTVWAQLIAGMIGINLLLLGVFRLGFLVQMFSRALLSGFINAVAIHIIIDQLGNLVDISTKGEIPEIVKEISRDMPKGSMTALIMGFCCLGFLITVRILKAFQFERLKWLKYLPDILITVLVATLVTHFTSVKDDLKVMGPRRTGFLRPGFGGSEITFDQFVEVFPKTFAIAIIGMVESILVCQIYASKLNYRVSNNRELVAIGLANCFGSIFKIFPTFGSLGRSAVNFQSGGRSQISSLITASIIGLSIMFLLPYFQYLPRVALAAVIINASFGIFEFDELLFLWRVKAWKDLSLFFFSFIATNLLGIETGISLTIAVSLLLLVKHTSFPHVVVLQQSDINVYQFEEVAVIRDINLFDEKHDYINKGILILRIDEALYFANIGQIRELLLKLESNGSVQIRGIVIVANNIPFIDATAAHTVLEMIIEWQHRGITVCIAKPKLKVLNMMARSGILSALGKENLFYDLGSAFDWLNQKIPNVMII
eukprot:TRINITY_DN6204_c0_g1_i2.p1 TRINITY_DN6204_c0_g1~~TRINITY_DN6204_c0_g1_i2.p1  ORF type:complete len:706 (+),score=159.50 TRINITY_DN6204_c0_g1_i2:156-2273(+)